MTDKKKSGGSSVIRKLYVCFFIVGISAGLVFPVVVKLLYGDIVTMGFWLLCVGFGAVFALANIMAVKAFLLNKLKEVVRVANAFAEKDLSQRCEFASNDDIGAIVSGMNHMAEDVHYSIGMVEEATNRLADAARRVSNVSAETDRCVTSQQTGTEHVSSAMNEMAQTAQEMSSNAQSAMEAMMSASKEAQEGALVATEAIGGIDNLIKKVSEAATVIAKLREDSNNIGTVLDVIRGIAEQTNLLALNAAIEAARAGEQGRGFAVVADEVRTLASRTQKSTDEIQDMIVSLQTNSNAASKVMEDVNSRGVSGSDHVEKTAESLAGIAGTVNRIKEMNDHITSAIQQQQQVADEINEDLMKISEAGEETAAGSQQTHSASEDLLRQVESLKDVVSAYKL